MKTIYLAGGINGLSDAQCKDWREIVKQGLASQFKFLDPMRRDYRGKEADSVEAIVEGDTQDILASDFILAMCNRASWGTAMEIRMAWRCGIPVIIVCDAEHPSPWLLYHCVKRTKSVEEAIDYFLGL